ncbi:MAG: glutamine-hydrolyzing carbamoyl-phosphate synthase small subunit [Sphaerochaetaceae bacterium]|nr:glutamine-hydrolyzing carbamoyl-phosphate synthase small subunit [Sphaerochaetaceae bacterium]
MATLFLEDGSKFEGKSFGVKAPNLKEISWNKSISEIVFNTSMSGYQQILSDPSYKGQMVCFTYPQIGNYGIIKEEEETILNEKVHVSAIVVKDYYDGKVDKDRITLNQYLLDNNIIGISNIDTRALTIHLRDTGFKRAIIINEDNLGKEEELLVIKYLKSFPFISQTNQCEKVSTKKAINNPQIINSKKLTNPQIKCALIDFGIKKSIIKELYKRNVSVTLFPSNTNKDQILNKGFDLLFLSNGPGDPETQTSAIKLVNDCKNKIPIVGICLGHQIITLALGGKTSKMKFGHHGANQPVTDVFTKKTFVTSQNHSFVTSKLPNEAELWFKNSNDDSVEGLKIPSSKIMCVQFHPEASPGPQDSLWIFDEFIKEVK